MADTNVRVSGFTDSGSRERVAFDLMARITNGEPTAYIGKKAILDLYAECMYASSGHRTYPKP